MVPETEDGLGCAVGEAHPDVNPKVLLLGPGALTIPSMTYRHYNWGWNQANSPLSAQIRAMHLVFDLVIQLFSYC